METFFFIFSNNIIPVFILAFLGYLLDKKFSLNIYTISKINFYLFVPSFIIVSLYTTYIPADGVKVLLFAVLVLLCNMLTGTLISRIRGYDTAMKGAFCNSILFYNSGNVGLPLITLVFSSAPYIIDGNTPYLDIAITTQVAVIIVQNITTYTLGFYNAAKSNYHWKDSIKNILQLPVIYAVPAAFILKSLPFDFTKIPVWHVLQYSKNAMVAIALLALGIQISQTTIKLVNKDVYLSAAIRLLGGPALAFILVRIMQFEGIAAQTLLISSSVPTAVSIALIAVECNSKPDFSSQTVMVSTLMSGITLSVVIYAARILFPVV